MSLSIAQATATTLAFKNYMAIDHPGPMNPNIGGATDLESSNTLAQSAESTKVNKPANTDSGQVSPLAPIAVPATGAPRAAPTDPSKGNRCQDG